MKSYSKSDMTVRFILFFLGLGIIVSGAFIIHQAVFYPVSDEIFLNHTFKYEEQARFMHVIPVYGQEAVWPAPEYGFKKIDPADIAGLMTADHYYAFSVYPRQAMYMIRENQELQITLAAVDRSNSTVQYRSVKKIRSPLQSEWTGYYEVNSAALKAGNIEVDFRYRLHPLLQLGLATFLLFLSYIYFRIVFYGPIKVLAARKKAEDQAGS